MDNNIQKYITNIINDPITKLLLNNSILTNTQLETLLIDILVDKISNKRISYEEKVRYRQKEKNISRGSFNRTLKQATNNVDKAIFTLLLLAYLRLFDSQILKPFIELSSKFNRYIKNYEHIITYNKNGESLDRNKKYLLISKKQLLEHIKRCLDKV